MKLNTRKLVLCAAVAAVYAVMSFFGEIFGLTYGPVQCRFAEALCVLPFLVPETAWGLFLGCVLTNLMSAYGPIDVVFGSLATLLAALCTARVKSRWLAPLPPETAFPEAYFYHSRGLPICTLIHEAYLPERGSADLLFPDRDYARFPE